MENYFVIEFCRGPFNITEDILEQEIEAMVRCYSLDQISSLWENFSFVDDLLELAADEVGEKAVMEQNEDWLAAVRKNIAKEIFLAAKEIYLEESSEATWRVIDGKKWIFSGGKTWDGFTTEAAQNIKLIRWSGLDEILAQR